MSSTPPRAGSLAAIPAGRRTKWLMLIVWLIVFMVLGSFAGKLQGAEKNDAAAWLPASAESTQVVKLEEQFRKSDTALAVVVYQRSTGITSADKAQAQADAAKFGQLVGAAGPAQGPFPSKDGKALQTLVPVEGKKVIDFTDPARDLVKRGPPGLTAHITGPAGGAADSIKVFESLDGFLLMAAGIVVIVLLLLIYRSPVLWIVPVVSVVSSLAVAMGVVYLLAAHAGLTVNGQSGGILPVLVFGVGTDYALLLIARYREELHRHRDKHEAMAFALHRAGPAILASAATVAIGLLCLMAAELNSTAGLGPVSAIGVVCALAAMTTLMPALLVILPRAVFWPKVPRFDVAYENPDAYDKEHGVWARVAKLVSARPRLIWMVTAAALIAMTFGLTSLHANGLSNAGQFVSKPDSVAGEAVVARHFPAGSGAPAVIIGDASTAGPLHDAIARTPGVAEVSAPVTAGSHVQYEAVLSVAADSKAAQDTIDRLRTVVHPLHGKVGGQTASSLDMNRAASHDNKLIIPIVLAVVFLILILLLRSVVAPLLMMVTVVLSFAASLGVSGLIFDKLFGFEGADAGFPLLAFIFLVALGVDYNIFLMTRVREESQVLGTRRGVLRGLTVTGGVITSAGLVLAATFAALTTLPLVGMVEMGFVVAFGVLLDTVIVRSLLLPALAFDLGRRIWAPGRLAREEPEVEGPEPKILQPVS
jgi:RND superfamily putative drug exporter